jgi:hypothetical protein
LQFKRRPAIKFELFLFLPIAMKTPSNTSKRFRNQLLSDDDNCLQALYKLLRGLPIMKKVVPCMMCSSEGMCRW